MATISMDINRCMNPLVHYSFFPLARRTVTTMVVVCVTLCLVSTTLFAQTQTTEVQTAQEILGRGAELETQKQWGEALSLYQQAVRKYPENLSLQRRRSVARIHYDVQRRYADSSFIKTINTTDGQKAAGVYREVLLKVQSYYVDQPKWSEIASFGLTSLEVALMSPEFREVNLPNVYDPPNDPTNS